MTINTPTLEWRQYWAEMEFGCRQILRYTQNMNEATFYQNKMAVDAVLYNLEGIYQAAQSLPDDVHPWLKEEEWRTLASFKEITANARFNPSSMGLWAVVDEQIPTLLAALRAAHQKETQIKQDPRLHRRGRSAIKPWHLPLLGWRDIGWRVLDQLSQNNVLIVSAGVAFYALLAIFPTLAALVSIYGVLANPADVEAQLTLLDDVIPAEAWEILRSQLHTLTSQSTTILSLSALLGVLLTLWSARLGTGALMTALNIVYKEEEKRSWIRFNLMALLLTLGEILFSVAALSLIVALPTLLGYIGLGEETKVLLIWLRWPLLAVIVIIALAILYRFGSSRRAPRWEWVSIGAVVATLLWILVSALFSFYVSHFGSYNETYGSLGAVVSLMLWFWLTALTVLIGAEFNAEMEHQTKMDTTTGKPKPMGKRNAYMADTLGRRP
ncbi:YhjD/YihY/BrkB family envelope integrity protein [Nitrosococcus wardiae]|uniref:YihY family inner membrane protein n=1 Tax=Nitrosococcus wardiae TaxID=1814290 RepID=A0A4P7BZR9_9GAMM|nr:YhjD/YihY/BrkB family envelope integrity protein [Nitrosococcus wardiae]QBQ55748.1 YihY family inner membrane protein [Nitrosococcus wardiae]